jgi:hypothetical protein
MDMKYKIEITELCEIYLGRKGKAAYSIFVSIYMYSLLWAYSSVFGNALAAHVPIFGDQNIDYLIYLLVYAMLVVPLSCIELNEQKKFQVVLAICRAVMVLLMVSTVSIAMFSDFFRFSNAPIAPYGASAIDFSNIYIILPIAAYANIFHHSIPSLSHPVREKDKLGSIYLIAIGLCFIAYSSIAISTSIFFGDLIYSSSNLNWVDFQCDSAPILGTLISFFVVLFPALDVASAFPLNAITLGNNLFLSIVMEAHAMNSDMTKKRSIKNGYKVANMIIGDGHQWNLFWCRVIAAFPPICMAAFVSNLGEITAYAGVTGFIVAFVFPALLAIKSRRSTIAMGKSPQTAYTISDAYEEYLAIIVCIIGSLLAVYVVLSLLLFGTS